MANVTTHVFVFFKAICVPSVRFVRNGHCGVWPDALSVWKSLSHSLRVPWEVSISGYSLQEVPQRKWATSPQYIPLPRLALSTMWFWPCYRAAEIWEYGHQGPIQDHSEGRIRDQRSLHSQSCCWAGCHSPSLCSRGSSTVCLVCKEWIQRACFLIKCLVHKVLSHCLTLAAPILC